MAIGQKQQRYKADSPDWLEVGPLRDWIERTLVGMSVDKFCKTAHIQGRRLWGLRYESHHVNYYLADRILTYHSGPPLWELYPDADERT